MPKGYTTKTKVEDFLNTTISMTDEKFDDFIEAVEIYIDNFTGRNFIADSEASVRVYNGDSSQNLRIDDCVEITKVEVGSGLWGDLHEEIGITGEDRYYSLPFNYQLDKVPINEIILRARYWIAGLGNHKITAKWGWSEAVPSDISWASTFLVASIYKQGQGGNMAGIQAEKIGEYSVTFQDGNEMSDFKNALVILNKYKRYVL